MNLGKGFHADPHTKQLALNVYNLRTMLAKDGPLRLNYYCVLKNKQKWQVMRDQ
jgi:hypothetical protein